MLAFLSVTLLLALVVLLILLAAPTIKGEFLLGRVDGVAVLAGQYSNKAVATVQVEGAQLIVDLPGSYSDVREDDTICIQRGRNLFGLVTYTAWPMEFCQH